MKQTVDRHRRLADYIYDDLDQVGIVEIENEISNDPQLSDSYRLNMQVKDYLKAKILLEEMKSDPSLEEAERLADLAFDGDPGLEEVRENSKDISRVSKSRWIYLSAIAATLTLFFVIRVFVPFTNTDRLYQHYYQPLDASDYSRRGEVNDLYKNLSEGINSYIQGNYEQSNLLLGEIGSDQVGQPEVQFFSGLNDLALGQYDSAREILQNYLDNNHRYLPEATWYLSLCYLKTGEVDKARQSLPSLEAYGGVYREKAQSLERKLRRIK